MMGTWGHVLIFLQFWVYGFRKTLCLQTVKSLEVAKYTRLTCYTDNPQHLNLYTMLMNANDLVDKKSHHSL